MNGSKLDTAVHSIHTHVGEHRWKLEFPALLTEVVVSNAAVGDALLRALRAELCVTAAGLYRAQIDAAGCLFGVVVNEQERLIRLGSPGFRQERLRCELLGTDAGDLAEFARTWSDASAVPRPMDIARATVEYDLVDIRARQPGTDLHLVEVRTRQLATQVDGHLSDYSAPLMERLSQVGLGLQADFAVLRIHALRFVALLPSLDHDRTGFEVRRLLVEMLRRIIDDSRNARNIGKSGDQGPLPIWLESACQLCRWASQELPARAVSTVTRRLVRTLAGIFIAGEDVHAAQPTLQQLAATGRNATLDQLGELVVSEAEADRYLAQVLELVDGTGAQHNGARNAAGIPLAHVSIKVSALCAHYDPDDPDGTWLNVGPRLVTIFEHACGAGVFIHLDAEHYAVRDLTFTMLKRALREEPAFWAWADVGIVVQAYLTDAPKHLHEVLDFAAQRPVRMPLRLVKGAYWDEETTEARANGWDAPQFLNKAETDACFQQLSLKILAAGSCAQLCIGSHNLRDHCFARAARELLYPDAPAIEHQALHRTYEALSSAMAAAGWTVRNYIPVGSLLVGMAYLVRRIMENSSQVGVLTMARDGFDLHASLRTPPEVIRDHASNHRLANRPSVQAEDPRRFVNVAPSRLYLPEHRSALQAAIDHRAQHPSIGTPRPFRTGEWHVSRSPSDHTDVGTIQLAQTSDVDGAVAAARTGWRAWRQTHVKTRADALIVAAERMRTRRAAFAAIVALEAGKAREEALADVDEAIDFLRFYALEALRREDEIANVEAAKMPKLRPRGVIAVVAPWNFPLAIPCGMTAAALAAGNAVVLKSAEQTPLVAEALVDLLHEAGVPTDALIHLPGDGLEVGAPLTSHDQIAGVVFTGSKAVGTLLHDKLALLAGVDDARTGRLVITEMGGKNAVIVTANADLDEAVGGCLYAAFGHAGQKCSAASRILVDQRVYATFTQRLRTAIADLKVGAGTEPGVQVNAVVTSEDAVRLRQSAAEAVQECERFGGTVIADRSAELVAIAGNYVGPCAFGLPASAASSPDSVAQQELFGPLIHVIAYTTLDEAIALFNSTDYALTGGVYAQSHDDIDRLTDQLLCGNLYVNRPCTAARVSIEPFGGFRMSGTGPKAGGSRYLDAFYAPAAKVRRSRSKRPGDDEFDRPTALASYRGLSSPGLRLWRELRLKVHADRRRMMAVREWTRRIPGQDNRSRWDRPRGDVLVLATGDDASEHTVAHISAALAAANTVTVLAYGRCEAEFSEISREAGAQMRVLPATQASLDEVCASPATATLVCDGIVAAWTDRLQLAPRPVRRRNLWSIYDETRGPEPDDFDGLWRCHTVERTVIINMMRHGAPLALDDDF